MSKHLSVILPPAQRASLTKMTRSGVAGARILTRARILLLADRTQAAPKTHGQIAAALQVSMPTIGAVCRRFVLEGMAAALAEKPRPGKVPKITGAVEAQLTLLACSDPPPGRARWTMQLLADTLVAMRLVESISDSAVCARLKKTRSSPGGCSASASARRQRATSPKWRTC